MPLRIDPNNPKNIEFLEFIIGKIKEKGELIPPYPVEITIQKDVTVFPVFEKIEPSGDLDQAAAEARLDANKDYDQEADHIGRYLYATFKEDIFMRSPMPNFKNPLALDMIIMIHNPHGIWRVAEELKRKQQGNPVAKEKITETQKVSLPIIEYDNQSGLGYVNGKGFKLRTSQPSYSVFSELYKNMGKVVPYARILELSGYTKNNEGEWEILDKKKAKMALFNQGAKYFINKLAVKIRAKTSLSDVHFVLNSGDIVLRGIKVKKETK